MFYNTKMTEEMVQGDYLNSNSGGQNKKNKFFISIVVAIVGVVVLIYFVFVGIQDKKQEEDVSTQGTSVVAPAVTEKKVITESEKSKILERLSVNKSTTTLKTGGTAQFPSLGTTGTSQAQIEKQRIQILQNLSTTTQKTSISEAEKMKILDSLR